MLRSCKYCGRIHDTKVDCGKKPRHKKNTVIDKFRSTMAWQDKRTEIGERDKFLCQVCIRKLYNTAQQFNYDNISIHHIIPIAQDYDKRLDNDNLICICGYHHEMAERGTIPKEALIKIAKEQENNPPGGVCCVF